MDKSTKRDAIFLIPEREFREFKTDVKRCPYWVFGECHHKKTPNRKTPPCKGNLKCPVFLDFLKMFKVLPEEKSENEMESRFLSVEEVGAVLKLEPEIIRRKIRSKELKAYKIGKCWRISTAQLEAYLQKCLSE